MTTTRSTDFNPENQLRWCTHWWDHPDAVARLWAMAGAYAVLVDADDAPADGPSTWWLQHADPHLAVLLDKDNGPFSQCTHQHRITGGLPWREPTQPVTLLAIAGPRRTLVTPQPRRIDARHSSAAAVVRMVCETTSRSRPTAEPSASSETVINLLTQAAGLDHPCGLDS